MNLRRLVLPVLSAAVAATSLVASGPAVGSSHDMVATRARFFGAANVSPTGEVRADRVILSWFGVTNFAAAIGGHVVLLDAWVPRGEYSGYVPTSPAELAALEPEAIFIGHGHFDHAADAAEIVGRSPSTKIVGTPEHCDQVRKQAGASVLVTCVEAAERGAAPGAKKELGALPGVGITAITHVHSAAERPDASDPHTPAAPPPDANAVVFHLPAPQDTAHLFSHLGDAEAGTVLYQFRVGAFSLTWHDSSGPLKERAPGVFGVMATLPATDVHVGAIMGFNQITNGLRDPRMYMETLRPKVFIPSHHDNWAPGLSTRGQNYRPVVEEEFADASHHPVLRFISDPEDYVAPIVFDVTAPNWA